MKIMGGPGGARAVRVVEAPADLIMVDPGGIQAATTLRCAEEDRISPSMELPA